MRWWLMGTRYHPACRAARYSSNISTPLGRRVATTAPGWRSSPRRPCTTWLVRPSSCSAVYSVPSASTSASLSGCSWARAQNPKSPMVIVTPCAARRRMLAGRVGRRPDWWDRLGQRRTLPIWRRPGGDARTGSRIRSTFDRRRHGGTGRSGGPAPGRCGAGSRRPAGWEVPTSTSRLRAVGPGQRRPDRSDPTQATGQNREVVSVSEFLQGKVVAITGAGGGIGRAVALLAAAEGAKVVVADIGVGLAGEDPKSEVAEALVADIEAAGGEAVAVGESVTTLDGGEKIVGAGVERWGRIDGVVAIAGILRERMLFNMAEDEWDAVIETHLKGHFTVFRAASAVMRKQEGGGSLVAFTSGAFAGSVAQANYAAAKG